VTEIDHPARKRQPHYERWNEAADNSAKALPVAEAAVEKLIWEMVGITHAQEPFLMWKQEEPRRVSKINNELLNNLIKLDFDTEDAIRELETAMLKCRDVIERTRDARMPRVGN
jgi:hypothetical protein